MKTGVLLINLGTPATPDIKAVRRYLREFLSDPYVIDINFVARWLLVNGFILPHRAKQSTQAYQSIWTTHGSPLRINSQILADNAQRLLGEKYQVVLGMRYGEPSLANAMAKLTDCKKLIILPLFPQYSLAATQSTLTQAQRMAQSFWATDQLTIIKSFYNAPSFIEEQAKLIVDTLQRRAVEKIIFSYHGLPQRQVKKSCHAIDLCRMQGKCPAIDANNQDCYRAQCFSTSTALAKSLSLQESEYMTTFQSRLGRLPWIEPYTDMTLNKLATARVSNIAIVCPSFVVDCLETLEEIGIRARRQWQALGGKHFYLIPCVNGNAGWVEEVIKLAV